jgi:cell shape-determining protein MreD
MERDLIRLAQVIAVLVIVLAVWRGDRPTRLVGLVYGAGFGFSFFAFNGRRSGVEILPFLIDAACLTLFVLISLRWRRLWIAVTAACLLMSTVAHAAALLDLRIAVNTIIMTQNIWNMAALAALLWGVVWGSSRPPPADRTA